MGKLKLFMEGMRNLTPLQLKRAELVGYIGNIFGIFFAWYFMLQVGLWYFSIVFSFAIFLSCIALVRAYQDYKNLKDFDDEILCEGVRI